MVINSLLVFMCVLFNVDVGWRALIISALLAISTVAFVKFMWLLFLIFQANLIVMERSIRAERLEKLERRLALQIMDAQNLITEERSLDSFL